MMTYAPIHSEKLKFSSIFLCVLLFMTITNFSHLTTFIRANPQFCETPVSIRNKHACGSNSTQQIYDFFAGYKLITPQRVFLKKLSQEHSILGSSVVVDDFSKCDSTTAVYISNGCATVASKRESYGKCLVSEMITQMEEILALPCDHSISYASKKKTFMAKNGGVYCFETGYTIIIEPIFIISGSERVVFRLKASEIINPKFIHMKCSSYRNVFLIMDGPMNSSIRGDVDCTIINHNTELTLGGLDLNTVKGAIWSTGNGSLTFSDVIIGNATSFDPFERLEMENFTLCSDIKSTAKSVCSGKGKCDDYNVCNCHTHYYGSNCELTSCDSIPSNNSSVCSGIGNCTGYNKCTCEEGFGGKYCQNIYNPLNNGTNQTITNSTEKVIQDEFAGYKLITTGSIQLQNVRSLQLSASIVIGSMGPQRYLSNGSAVITLFTDPKGSELVQMARKKLDEITSLPCQFLHVSQNTKHLHVKNGGVYCFHQGWASSDTVIVEGTEPVVFKLSSNLNYNAVKFSYLQCASYRNVFWLVSGSSSLSGTFEGTLVPYGGVNMNNVVINGAVWNLGGGSMNFNNVVFTPPLTFDIYEPIRGDFCDYTLCENVKSSDGRACSGHGSCMGYNQCSCHDGYHSLNCSIGECHGVLSNMSTVCGGHGTCISKDKCKCNDNYYGNMCQYSTCIGGDNSSKVCSQHGVCNTLGECVCNTTFDYGGPNCEYPICDGYWSNNENVCSGRGICLSPNICSCDSDVYYGQFCELTTCGGLESNSSIVCSKRGTCYDYNTCLCQDGYFGDDCETISCFGVSSLNQSVCSGQGFCKELNSCDCQEGYNGFNCQNTTCFGILSDLPNVCSSHGNCTGFNRCTCEENFFGIDCEITTCNSVNSTDQQVCSSHGSCNSTNICICSLEYYGQWCELTTCGEIESNNSLVCSGHGQCLDYNHCKCLEGYVGSSCEDFYCYGVPNNNSSTCSGNGICIDLNLCSCQLGFEGSMCEMKVENETIVELNNTSLNGTIPYNETNETVFNNETVSSNFTEKDFDNNTAINQNISCNETIQNETLSNETISTNETHLCNETLQDNRTETTNSSFNNETFLNETSLNCTIENCTLIENKTDFSNSSTQFNHTIPNPQQSLCDPSLNCSSHGTTNSSSFNNETFLNETSLNCTNLSNCDVSIENGSLIENKTDFSNSSTQFNHTIPNPHQSLCDPSLNCSSHGTCLENGTCKCHSDFMDGFWNGPQCSSCLDGFFGRLCATKIQGPAMFTSDFRGIVFTLFLPENYSNINIPCDLILSGGDISKNLFGDLSFVKCQYVDKQLGKFMITFGSIDYMLLPGSIIHLNTLIFDSIDSNTQIYNSISFQVDLPSSFQSSQTIIEAIVRLPNMDIIGLCEDILIDGSYSYSVDGKPLIYHWKLLNALTLQPLPMEFPNKPIVRLNSFLGGGEYVMALTIESTFLNVTSSQSLSTIFKKSENTLPSIYIPLEVIEKTTTQFPFTIRKVLRESSCQTNRSIIEWSQLSGPEVEFHIDQFNNLVVSKLMSFGTFIYIFKIVAYYPENPQEKVSSFVTLKTKSPQLTLKISQLESSIHSTTLQIDYFDPESVMNTNNSTTETWKWTCDLCTVELRNILNDLATHRTALFTIDSSMFNSNRSQVELELRIEKLDGRFVEQSTTVKFENIPSIMILSVEPQGSYVKQGQSLSVQVLTTCSFGSGVATLKWSLNGRPIGKMLVFHQSTNILSIETGQLENESTNTLTMSVTDLSNKYTSTITHTFSIYLPPRPCHCTIEPLEGFALETEFDFYCSNCRNAGKYIDYKYGFIDDRSGSRIYLYSYGEMYASKLPSPFYGSMINCFFDIHNYETGASFIKYINVTVKNPTITDITQIQTLVQQWEDLSSVYFLEGDFSRSIYQVASTSRTDSVLLRETLAYMIKNSKRSIVESHVKCVHGVDINGKCKCVDGYVGPSCDFSIKDFSNIQATKLNMLDNIIIIINATEGTISNNYLSLFAFAIDSLLFNYEYLDSNTISESIFTMNMFLRYALLDSGTKLVNGIDTLLNACIDSAYNYIVDKQYLTDQTSNSRQLLKALKQAMILQTQGAAAVNFKTQITGPFYEVVTGKNILYEFQYSIQDSKSKTLVEFDNDFLTIDTQSSGDMTKELIYSVVFSSDIYSLDRNLKKSQKITETSYKLSNLISPIVSVHTHNIPVPIKEHRILYTIPINMSTAVTEAYTDLFDFIQQEITYSCGNFYDNSLDISLDCSMISKNETFVQCRCSLITNVFVMQTVTTSYFSVLYILALSFVLMFVCCSCCVSIIGAITYCKSKRNKKTTTVHPYTEDLSVHYADSPIIRHHTEHDLGHHSGDEGLHDQPAHSLEEVKLIGKKIMLPPVFLWKKVMSNITTTIPTQSCIDEHTTIDLYDEDNCTKTHKEELEDVPSETDEKINASLATKSSYYYCRKQSINPTALTLDQVKSSLKENAVSSKSTLTL